MSAGASQPSAQEYLGRVLELDPAEGLQRVLELRAERRGFASARAASRPREDVLEQLLELERAFWSTESDDLIRRLSTLEHDAPPDLRRRIRRLQVVARSRPELDEALAEDGMGPVFADMLRQVLVAPAGERAARMTQQEERLGQVDVAREVLRSTNLLRRQWPRLWQLEHRWLSGLPAEVRRVCSLGRLLASRMKSQPFAEWRALDFVLFLTTVTASLGLMTVLGSMAVLFGWLS